MFSALAFSSPSIVTRGLILNYNVSDRTSCRPGSTVLNDLSGNNNNSVLNNGPTFDSTNGGFLSFDGTNDYGEITTRNTALEFQPTQPYSIFVWFRGPASQTSAIISNMDGASPNTGWDIYFNSSLANTIATHLISSWPTNAFKVLVTYNFTNNLNSWINFGVTYDGSCPTTAGGVLNSINFYWSGSLYTTGKAMADATDGFNSSSETTTYNTSQRFRVASRWASGVANTQATVSIANALIYNRVLTAQEIRENFEAQRSRFGV